LGLAIVRKLTVLMGGSARVTSIVGEGSVFTIQLPLNVTHTQMGQEMPLQGAPDA
jgi:signal transduction histidine kinase